MYLGFKSQNNYYRLALVRVSQDFQFGGGGGECCVWNRLSDENLTHLMRNAIEVPDLNEVNFNEIPLFLVLYADSLNKLMCLILGG